MFRWKKGELEENKEMIKIMEREGKERGNYENILDSEMEDWKKIGRGRP